MTFHGALWNWTSPVWLIGPAILAAHTIAFGRSQPRHLGPLLVGLVLLVLAFVSPIGVLADGYLFSAHMVQHLLLLLVIPLCLLLSLGTAGRTTHSNDRRPVSVRRLVGLAIVGWLCGVGAMWLWHVPSICSAATQSRGVSMVRDTSFVAAGLVFWWPIYGPHERFRLPPLGGIVYLFSACLGCTLLGIYITFATISVCPAFANPVDRLGVLNGLYDAGLTPSVDQHLGGLLMWVPPCTLYVSAIISLLCRWYTATDEPAIPGALAMASGRQT